MTPDTLPYEPRLLSRRERDREDVYLFHSPKVARAASVIGPLRLAFWLEHEFTPHTVHIIERPRSLTLADGRSMELDFWTRSVAAEETFWIAVSAEETLSSGRDLASKDHPHWQRAAQLAGINVGFVFEHDVHQRAQHVANYLRMLPYVQALRRQNTSSQAMTAVKELFSHGAFSLSFAQIDANLPPALDGVGRMAACALVHAGWLRYDESLPLTPQTRLHREQT